MFLKKDKVIWHKTIWKGVEDPLLRYCYSKTDLKYQTPESITLNYVSLRLEYTSYMKSDLTHPGFSVSTYSMIIGVLLILLGNY
jgi:hypothetical protein